MGGGGGVEVGVVGGARRGLGLFTPMPGRAHTATSTTFHSELRAGPDGGSAAVVAVSRGQVMAVGGGVCGLGWGV